MLYILLCSIDKYSNCHASFIRDIQATALKINSSPWSWWGTKMKQRMEKKDVWRETVKTGVYSGFFKITRGSGGGRCTRADYNSQ